MSALPRSESLRWLKIADRKQTIVILSDATAWASHWDVAKRRSRRCAGERCAMCALGLPVVWRYVMLVRTRIGTEELIELRERHADQLDSIRNQNGTCAGAIMMVWRSGSAINSPIEISLRDFETVQKRAIDRLVDQLGLPAKHVEEVLEMEDSLEGFEFTQQPDKSSGSLEPAGGT